AVIRELVPGPGVLHMEFTARGTEVWVSVRDANKVVIYDAQTFEQLGEIAAANPSGIFFTARAHRAGL
ncbi:MAG TPA: cytochrome D1 domain-containing protein, partial [Paracoccaceae bacterium]